MTTKQITAFLGEWSSQLNKTQQAGATVYLQNEAVILKIKNKRFTPFYCVFEFNEKKDLILKPATQFDFGKNTSDTINNRLYEDVYQNYHFGKIALSGELKHDLNLISLIVAHAANKFFFPSDFACEEIQPFKLIAA